MAEKRDDRRLKTLRRVGHKPPIVPSSAKSESVVPVAENLPPSLLLLPVSQTTLFPGMMVPFILPEGKLTTALERALASTGHVGVVLHRENYGDPVVASGPSTSISGLPPERAIDSRNTLQTGTQTLPFYKFGVAAKILKKINLPDNQVSVLLAGLQRFEMRSIASEEPYYIASVDYIYDEVETGIEVEALIRSALQQFKQLSKDNPLISEEVKVALVNIDGPGKLADFMASVLIREANDYEDFLAMGSVKARLQQLLVLLKKENDVQTVQRKMNDEINQKVSSAQKEFYLQEQLKFIQKELGRSQGEKNQLIEKYRVRLKDKQVSEEGMTRIEEEFEKLSSLHEQSSEYSVSVNYLDWVTSLPWGVRTSENLSLAHARQVLEADHHGLKDVKERILEFLAVRKLKKSTEGSILCFVGPPGTGKTSLGKSIARALQRKFFRFSVGGMRDEAEIKGHRRTYVGAMPGKLIQGLKRVGAQNPVFLIDEIDKMASHSIAGDPASAMLELLDPEQNPEFLDHYIDIPFNCSNIFFVTTANTIDTIPHALLDRMEIIFLHGYTDQEKFAIARKYLIPKQLKKNAVKASQIRFTDKGLRYLILHYARESGVRNLEKQIGKICRKVAYRVATGRPESVKIDEVKVIEKFLGPPIFPAEDQMLETVPGVVTGLAWTQFGGDVLHVESVTVEGKGGIVLTGSLGDVMQESANIAYTYVRSRGKDLKLPKSFFEKNSFHLHVPSGATPKDGPSAGITMAASLYSLICGKAVRPYLAMTGELTLTGRVLPVGGIKEKLLAAKRAGMKKILIPKQNMRDLQEVEKEIRAGLEIRFVGQMDEVLKHLWT
jgi:ATP-dependent Lon protease